MHLLLDKSKIDNEKINTDSYRSAPSGYGYGADLNLS